MAIAKIILILLVYFLSAWQTGVKALPYGCFAALTPVCYADFY